MKLLKTITILFFIPLGVSYAGTDKILLIYTKNISPIQTDKLVVLNTHEALYYNKAHISTPTKTIPLTDEQLENINALITQNKNEKLKPIENKNPLKLPENINLHKLEIYFEKEGETDSKVISIGNYEYINVRKPNHTHPPKSVERKFRLKQTKSAAELILFLDKIKTEEEL